MTVAGIIAYKFLAHATYLHVYTLTGMPVSATQVDSTFDLLACNLREGTRGPRNRHVFRKHRYARTQMACKCTQKRKDRGPIELLSLS
jgi:hypothetical protein